jgi:hypothetical protein
MPKKSVLWLASILVASAFLIQASPASAAEKSPYLAPKDKALVVFVRDRFRSRKISMIIINEKRQCIAFIAGDKDASELIPMEPGKHTLYALIGVIQRVDLEVEVGRTYFVRANYRSRYAAPTINLTPARRGTDTFKEVSTWIDGAKINDHTNDECKDTQGAPIETKRGRIQKKIDREDEEWKAKDQAYRDEHTGKKSDGMTPKELAKL